jgi:hypothetical protein
MARKQFSLGGMVKELTVFSFDDSNLYVGEGPEARVVPLEQVVSLEQTTRTVNNRYFWRIEYQWNGTTEAVEFRTNATLWNRTFAQFHTRLSQTNPGAVRSPCQWWTT